MQPLAFLPALLFGIAAAIQSPTNASLAQKTSSTQATLVSFTGGALLLGILVVIFDQRNLGLALGLPAWQLIGGLYGAITVFGLTLVIPRLGAALSVTLLTLGQLITSMLIDANGWFGVDPIVTNTWRIAGIIVLAVGIMFVYKGKQSLAAPECPIQCRTALYAFISFSLGFFAALQAPTNAALSRTVGYLDASFINFALAWVFVLVFALIEGKGRFKSMKGVRPWEVLGGLYGAIGVASTAVATTLLGAGLMTATGTFVELGASLVIDAKGFLGCSRIKTNPLRIAGVAIIAAGITLTAIGKAI